MRRLAHAVQRAGKERRLTWLLAALGLVALATWRDGSRQDSLLAARPAQSATATGIATAAASATPAVGELIDEACGVSNPCLVTSRFASQASGGARRSEAAILAFRDLPED